MTFDRFSAITGKYEGLRIAVVGDFCLDRYLEIDPKRTEVSIETGLPVHNVVKVRAQPGGAGTITNNLSALGIGKIFAVGFAGDDGEGFELRRALAGTPGVVLDCFLQTSDRRTFSYCKPLVVSPGQPPRELNRLDQKNWTRTPVALEKRLIQAMCSLAKEVDAFVLLDQVDRVNTGVLTGKVLRAFKERMGGKERPIVLADSRRGLRDFPSFIFKMNARELEAYSGRKISPKVEDIGSAAASLAVANGHPVFVTLAERGVLAASLEGRVDHLAAMPLRGPIDVVGAGDSVTANLAAALASGAKLREALELANAAGSVVIHQLGTTGTASIAQLRERLFRR
jgi:rfaE bifunctional protein kinase chain/domain